MSSAGQPFIVVGVSGSPASAGALRWAADEAARPQARLHIVCGWEEQHRAPYASAAGQPSAAQQRTAAAARLSEAIRSVFGHLPPAGLTAEVVRGLAARVLISRSSGADLLVLGSESPLEPAGRAAEPVVSACLRRSLCPVVVVCAAEQDACPPRPATATCHPQPQTTGRRRDVSVPARA
jgi:nucleotide-binding universal stress UspA family protein